MSELAQRLVSMAGAGLLSRNSVTAPSGAATLGCMSDVTRILTAIEAGDLHAAEKLRPLAYDELRKLAVERTPVVSPQGSIREGSQ
jgi:hypothetical protein